MTRVNVNDAKTHFSRYLDRVEAGETIILCRHNRPIAEMRPLAKEGVSKVRVAGMDKGKFHIPAEFFEPLPPEVLREFNAEEDQ
jgi:prevent-host-death family protein